MDLKVRAGEWNMQSTTERLPYQERNVSRIIGHPDYSANSNHIYDVVSWFKPLFTQRMIVFNFQEYFLGEFSHVVLYIVQLAEHSLEIGKSAIVSLDRQSLYTFILCVA